VSPSTRRKGSGQSRRRGAAIETVDQFRSQAAGIDPSRIPFVSDTLPIETRIGTPDAVPVGEPRQRGTLPVQGAIDRAVPLALPTFDVQVIDQQSGKLLETLRFPIFPPGRFGTDPNDPGYFSPFVNARTAICSILEPMSALQCLARGGAW
jgi:hypothetical protein